MSSVIANIALIGLAGGVVMLVIAIYHLLFRRKALRKGRVASLSFGIFILFWGFIDFAFTRDRSQAHQPSYYKYGLVTPEQGYAATTGIFLFGSSIIIVALCRRQDTDEDPLDSPTI